MVKMKEFNQIIKRITEIMYSPEAINQSNLLIVSKYSERTRVNLILLKYFLQEMNLRGIFITVDRPHQYISYLLKLHDIPQKNLLFIDTVSRISGGSSDSEGMNVNFMDGPYEVDFFKQIISGCYEAGDIPKNNVDFKEFDFILIDDIAAFVKYMDEDEAKELIISYLNGIKRLENIIAPVVLDINRNKKLYKILKVECERIIFINLMKSLVKNINIEKSPRESEMNSSMSKRIKIPNLLRSGV